MVTSDKDVHFPSRIAHAQVTRHIVDLGSITLHAGISCTYTVVLLCGKGIYIDTEFSDYSTYLFR